MIPLADNVPRRHRPRAVLWLIFANTLVFALELMLTDPQLERLFYTCGVVPARYTHPTWAARVGFPAEDYWPFVTSVFLHGGWIHLIGNMWMLWIFGDNVEDRMGPWRFALFYLVCGAAANLAHMQLEARSTVPAVGASGAIAGVLGAYFVLFPRARVLGMIPILFYPFVFELPAYFYLYWWFLTQLLSGTLALASPESGGGIAWWAHVGGFVAGVATFWIFTRRSGRRR